MVSINLIKAPIKAAIKNIIPSKLRYIPKSCGKDCFIKSKNIAKDIMQEFHPEKGAQIPLTENKLLQIAGNVTSNIEEQKLLLNMLKNESVVVTESVEKGVMKKQFNSFLKKHPETDLNKVFIYSPMPKGQAKSYTRSGKIFSEANNIPESNIKIDFNEIPKDATVFMADDCSITGASMVFDLLEHLPKDFEGKIILAPTVKGTGHNLKGDTMADGVLNLLTNINSKSTNRKEIVEELTNLISDNKKTNIEALNNILSGENYKNCSIEIADGSLSARNFRETETFKGLEKNEKRLVDALFSMSGLNNGYHSSGVMVLLPNKTPNNNVGIMDLIGEAMQLKVKPNGLLTYSENLALKNQNKKCAIGLLPASNNKGNFKEIIYEIPNTGKSARIPFDSKKDNILEVKVKLPTGEIKTIEYKPQLEEKDKISQGRLFGFNIGESISKLFTALKGHYQPKSVHTTKGFYVDVLAIPNNAEIISIGNQKLNNIA